MDDAVPVMRESVLGMPLADFETLLTEVLVVGLIAYMCYIIWKIGRHSKAGRFGMMVLFVVLGFGMLGVLIKPIIAKVLGIG
ncbi:MAG: hypothetical protein RIS59_860 [Pseudomonadota bacterium]|jgi:hypothetical protein